MNLNKSCPKANMFGKIISCEPVHSISASGKCVPVATQATGIPTARAALTSKGESPTSIAFSADRFIFFKTYSEYSRCGLRQGAHQFHSGAVQALAGCLTMGTQISTYQQLKHCVTQMSKADAADGTDLIIGKLNRKILGHTGFLFTTYYLT